MASLFELVKRARRVTVLTGAGVSTDSGFPDFITLNATWAFEEPREVMLSAPYFLSNPARFWEVYRATLGMKNDLKPNVTHEWIASLEEAGKEVTVVTQNVDGLHQQAGSTRVLEVHGTSHQVICLSCGEVSPMEPHLEGGLPFCDTCGVPLKPNVSLFMEGVNHMAEARDAMIFTDVVLVMGTSLMVGPVNELPYVVGRGNASLFQVNRRPAPAAYDFNGEFVGELSDFVKAYSL